MDREKRTRVLPSDRPILPLAAAALVAVSFTAYALHMHTRRYDAPCGAMVWTQQFLADIRTQVPTFRYRGVDIVAHVVAANRAKFASDPLTEVEVGDMTSDPVPEGYDMIFSRDALQHLTFEQIHGALRRFAESDAKWWVLEPSVESLNLSFESVQNNRT